MWAQGKARAERWTEEVALLLEEMRRTLAYCEWKSAWWKKRVEVRSGPVRLLDGTAAYASKQANMWESLAMSFAKQWAPLIINHDLPADWPPTYQDLIPDSPCRCSAHSRQFFYRVKLALMCAIQREAERSGPSKHMLSSDSE